MSARIIDGKKLSQTIFDKLTTNIELIKKKLRPPSLTVILVGDDPASKVYVEHKRKACARVGITSNINKLSKTTTEKELTSIIQTINEDENVDGILLQLPLPAHIDKFNVIETIKPNKDVDGLTPQNQGLLSLGTPQHIPCTPLGIMTLLKSIDYPLTGKTACVIGRSILVGSPITKLLTQSHATVTQIHSRTLHPKSHTQQADVLIVAAGQPNLVDNTWIKEGAVVIDVGIHRVDGKLIGDTNHESLKNKASYLTPVPGGVGPMTIASLLQNCLNAYLIHTGSKS